jgi:hypothetical protein
MSPALGSNLNNTTGHALGLRMWTRKMSRIAPPWRCQDCVKKDEYAAQRVVDVMRAENGQVFLLMEYRGYQYLEARPESWLEDKKGELRLAY